MPLSKRILNKQQQLATEAEAGVGAQVNSGSVPAEAKHESDSGNRFCGPGLFIFNAFFNLPILGKKSANDGAKSPSSGNKTVTISQFCSCPISSSHKMNATPNRTDYRMKERTSTINEDPSSHEDHPNQNASGSLPKPDSTNAVAASTKPTRGVLTKNSSFAMRTLTTRLSGFFRKFSTSSAVSGAPGGLTAETSDAGPDVCSTCHRLVKRPFTDKTPAGADTERGNKKPSHGDENDDDDTDQSKEEEVDFTSNILVGDLGNLTSILKKPSAFRQLSLDDDESNLSNMLPVN